MIFHGLIACQKAATLDTLGGEVKFLGTRLAPLFAVLALLLGLTACGSGSDNSVAEGPCFTQPNPADAAQLQQFMANQGNQAVVQQAVNGTQQVCVIDQTGNMAYYRPSDGFANYAMFALMAGRVHPLIGAGVLTGNIDPFTALILNDMLVSTNSSGYLYHPYRHVGNSWEPNTTIINRNVRVTNVYYGNPDRPTARKVSYSTSLKSKPPTGFQTATMPKPNNSVISVTKNVSGGITTSTVKNTSASAVVNNGGKIPTTTTKKGSSVVQNHSNSNRVVRPAPRVNVPRVSVHVGH